MVALKADHSVVNSVVKKVSSTAAKWAAQSVDNWAGLKVGCSVGSPVVVKADKWGAESVDSLVRMKVVMTALSKAARLACGMACKWVAPMADYLAAKTDALLAHLTVEAMAAKLVATTVGSMDKSQAVQKVDSKDKRLVDCSVELMVVAKAATRVAPLAVKMDVSKVVLLGDRLAGCWAAKWVVSKAAAMDDLKVVKRAVNLAGNLAVEWAEKTVDSRVSKAVLSAVSTVDLTASY
jgi:hypothetical protein